jgi:hypothetical protein
MNRVKATFDVDSRKVHRPTAVSKQKTGYHNDQPLLVRICWYSFNLLYISAALNSAFPT